MALLDKSFHHLEEFKWDKLLSGNGDWDLLSLCRDSLAALLYAISYMEELNPQSGLSLSSFPVHKHGLCFYS